MVGDDIIVKMRKKTRSLVAKAEPPVYPLKYTKKIPPERRKSRGVCVSPKTVTIVVLPRMGGEIYRLPRR